MKFLLADSQYMIHPETYEFHRLKGEENCFSVAVPFYLWKFKESFSRSIRIGVNGEGTPVYGWYSRTLCLPLNGLFIEFLGNSEYADVSFYDPIKKCDVLIELTMSSQTYLTNTIGGMLYTDLKMRLTGANYKVGIDGRFSSIKVELEEMLGDSPAFKRVPRLGCYNVPQIMINQMSWGIKPTPYRIIYKTKKLGRHFALLCGTWAILLTDKLQFDSVVSLWSVRQNTLWVERFIYTVNQNVIKAQILLG